MISIDETFLKRNKEISKELDCINFADYIHLLSYQYKIKQSDYTIESHDIDISKLICPQHYYTKSLYNKIASHQAYLDEPLVVVRTHDTIKFYLIIGNTRAKVAYDLGRTQLPAIVLFTYNDSLEHDLERSSFSDAGCIRHVKDLEGADV